VHRIATRFPLVLAISLGPAAGAALAVQGTREAACLPGVGDVARFGGDVGIGEPNPTAALHVDGDFVATGVKSFVQAHPEDPTREIWFVCLEGNEAGTYFRGTARLSGGSARIPVPEEFRLVTEPEGLTVQLTPVGKARLWLEEKSLEGILVRGDADVEFDYLVNGVRRGQAGFEPLRARASAPAPQAAPRGERPMPAIHRELAGGR